MTMGESCFILTLDTAIDATANFTAYPSLQAIMDAAVGGENIKLPITTYVENIVMNRSGVY